MSEREIIAEAQHEIWSYWMKYLFSMCQVRWWDDSIVVIPKELVERWTRLLKTPFEELTEPEKESDREQADKVIKKLDFYGIGFE